MDCLQKRDTDTESDDYWDGIRHTHTDTDAQSDDYGNTVQHIHTDIHCNRHCLQKRHTDRFFK